MASDTVRRRKILDGFLIVSSAVAGISLCTMLKMNLCNEVQIDYCSFNGMCQVSMQLLKKANIKYVSK